MTKHNDKQMSPLGLVFRVFAIPCNFFAGFLTGLVTPVVAIAAMVAGVRLITGKVPFLGHIWEDEDGGRRLSLKLVSPEQAKDLFTEQKDQIGGDIAKLQTEIKAIIEESKAEVKESTEGESGE